MKTKKLSVFLALVLVLIQILSLCVFAYEDYDDEDFEDAYEDDYEDYEDYDDYEDDYDYYVPSEIFWFFFVIFGFITPAVGAFVGYRISRSEKRRRPKYWLIFSAICLVWILLSAVLTLLISLYRQETIPLVKNDADSENTTQLFGVYEKYGVCHNGGYYYISDIDKKGVYRSDPDGGYYKITNEGYYHSLQSIGDYVYAIPIGAFGGDKKGICKISVNGDSIETLLKDRHIERYVVYQDSIYFTEWQDGDVSCIYEYTHSEVIELPLPSPDCFYVFNGSLIYSYEEIIYEYDSETRTSKKLANIPSRTRQWFPLENGFAVLQEYTSSKVLYIENDTTSVICEYNDYLYYFGICGSQVYVKPYEDNKVHLFDVFSKEHAEYSLNDDDYYLLAVDDELMVCIYNIKQTKHVVHKIN